MEYRSNFQTVNGVTIHYVEAGVGKPIVLIHGLTNNWEGNIPIAKILSKKYRVIIPDLPGYGDSGRLSHYNIEIMASYLSKLIGAIGIQPIAVVGLSMGGFIAAHFARVFPSQTDAAIVMGPVLKDKHRGVDASKYFFRFVSSVPSGRRILKRIIDTRSIAYLFAKHVNMYRFNKELIDAYGMRGKKKMTKDAYVEMGISASEYDLDATLQTLRIPTLLLYGREDKISSPQYAAGHVIPTNVHLELSVIARAGHVVSLERAQEAASAIMQFLQSL